MKCAQWTALSEINADDFPCSLRPWITNPLSMTARFKSTCGDGFYLKLLSQDEKAISESELKLLGLIETNGNIVREVEMGDGETPWLFGRTVFPKNLFEGETAEYFRNFGNKPLGEILFKDSTLKRSEFEIAFIELHNEEYKLIEDFVVDSVPVWARRSIFTFMQKKIMVMEVFLPVMS